MTGKDQATDKWLARIDVTQDYALSSQFIEKREGDIQSKEQSRGRN